MKAIIIIIIIIIFIVTKINSVTDNIKHISISINIVTSKIKIIHCGKKVTLKITRSCY